MVRLESAAARARLRQAESEVARLSAEIVRVRAQFSLSLATQEGERARELRRFRNDAEELAQERREIAATLGENRVELAGVEARLRRAKQLATEGFRSKAELEAVQVEHDRRAQRVREQASILRGVDERLRAARERERSYAAASEAGRTLGVELAPLEAQLEGQKHRVAELQDELARQVIRAPIAARVVTISKRRGEVVQAGEAIVELLSSIVDEVVLWVPPSERDRFSLGTAVELRRRGVAGAAVIQGSVQSVGARVELEAERLRLWNAAPRWGVPVTIAVPRSSAAVDGEAFDIRLPKTRAKVAEQAAPR